MRRLSSQCVERYVRGKALQIATNPQQLQFYDDFSSVGRLIWPSSDIIVKYLDETNLVEGRNILELGSGCGYLGISCGVLGAKSVTLTDMMITHKRMMYDVEGMLVDEEHVPSRALLDVCHQNSHQNASLTAGCKFNVSELQWGMKGKHNIDHVLSENETFDLIVGSDVTYHSSTSEHLMWTVAELLRRIETKNKFIVPSVADPVIKTSHGALPTPPDHLAADSRKRMITAAAVDKNRCRFITCHQHRLDQAFPLIHQAAVEAGLNRRSLVESVLNKAPDGSTTTHSIWEFTLSTS